MESQSRRGLLKGAVAVAAAFTGPSVLLTEAATQSAPSKTYSSGSPRVFYASQIPDVSLDCDLNTGKKIGGGTATDNTEAFNRILAMATHENPVTLILDGASVISGIEIPKLGHASILGLGWDTGFYVKSGSNADAIHNGGPRAAIPSDPASIGIALPPSENRGSNVRFADFRINGNRGDGHNGNSNTGRRRGSEQAWYFGINLMNMENIHIDHVFFYNIAAYNIRLSDCGYATITACKFDSPFHELNQDGVHLDGGCNDITISDCFFYNLDDDSIALNAPEGYGGYIRNVQVTNCVFENCRSLMRIYSAVEGGSQPVSGVVVSNCHGTFSSSGFVLGLGEAGKVVSGLPDTILDVTFSNCTLTTPWFAQVTNNFGSLKFNGCTWIAPKEAKAFVELSASVSSLAINGCSIYRTTEGNGPAYLFSGDSPVGTITINGFSIDDQFGHTFAPVPHLITQTGKVGRLIINALDLTNVAVFAKSLEPFHSIAGPGVLSTGVEFPDAAIADGTLYLSATTHLPSIKITGVVKTLTTS